MPRAAEVDFNNVFSIVPWLVGQWWFWAVVGVVVLLCLIGWLLPGAKAKPSADHPTDGPDANEIALGFLQIHNLPSGPWNDPTASGLTDREKRTLIDQWGVPTREEWLAAIQRLVVDRRRRDVWVSYLAIRADLASTTGRAPKKKEWVQAAVEAGADKRPAATFVDAIETLERQVKKAAGRNTIPAETFVTTLDGYAVGQSVALATWGVALGYADVTEVRGLIHEINLAARPAFRSWPDFGLSYAVGRVMHWSDGALNDKTFDKFGESTASDLGVALSEKRQGPWATLPWNL